MSLNGDQSINSIYYKPAVSESNPGKSPMLVLIPGNPGLIDFYTTYLDLIHEAFPKFEIWAVGHAGFFQSDEPFQFFNLEFQSKHKYEFLKELILKSNENRDIYFLSHSVGSYILQNVIKMLTEDRQLNGKFNLKFVGLICPTIVDIAKSHSGVFFTRIFKYFPVIQIILLISKILHILLSDTTAKAIIRKLFISMPIVEDVYNMRGWENSVEGAFKIYSSNQIMQQTLTLANEEMKVILRDNEFQDWFFNEFPIANNVKIWSFFAQYDYWVHDNTRDFILGRYHYANNTRLDFTVSNVEDGITHSFCVDQNVVFSKITIAKLKELFPNQI